MARMRLIDLLSHPENLDEKTLESLREALDTYPFFQSGRMLWVKNLHQLDHIRYNTELKLSAAYIPDRSKLFFLINDVFSLLSAPDEIQSQSVTKEEPEQKAPSVTQEDLLNERRNDVAEYQTSDKNIQPAEDDPSEELDRVVGADANYFEVDDSFTTGSGDLVDFSLSRERENEVILEEEKAQDKKKDDVLPAFGLLDFEKEVASSAYSLEKEVPPGPADFKESHSFSEWLDLLKYQTAKVKEEQEEPAIDEKSQVREKSGKMDLIENFLNNAGHQKRIVPGEDNSTSGEDFSARSVEESEDLMTETLANIHIKQKRYQKAVEIFERLRLKYPEKSVYFARRIKEMEDLINNQ
jgi:hypothetical protein